MSKIILPENQTKKIEVSSGYGYFVNAENQIISKAELPAGEKDIAGNLEYIEVASKEALEAIEVFKPAKTQSEIDENLIYAEMRLLAIESLKAKAKLPVEFVDKIAK